MITQATLSISPSLYLIDLFSYLFIGQPASSSETPSLLSALLLLFSSMSQSASLLKSRTSPFRVWVAAVGCGAFDRNGFGFDLAQVP